MAEFFYKNKLDKLLDPNNVQARHLYDIFILYNYFKNKNDNSSISSYTKYKKYLESRIKNVLIKKENNIYIPRGSNSQKDLFVKLIQVGTNFSSFKDFIKIHKQEILERINSIVHPGAEKFNISKFLKFIKTNFQYYEKLLVSFLR